MDNPLQPCSVIILELCAGETFRLRPASTQRFEHGRGQPRNLDATLRQSVFRFQTNALGVEDGQEVVHAELEALTSEISRCARRLSCQIEMSEAFSLLHIG